MRRKWLNVAAWWFLLRGWRALARRRLACSVGSPVLSVHWAGLGGLGFWGVRFSPALMCWGPIGGGRGWRLQVSGPLLVVGLAWLPAWYGLEEKRAGVSPAPLLVFGVLR